MGGRKDCINIIEMEIGEIQVFLESLESDEIMELIKGGPHNFDDPLKKAIEGIKEDERMGFVRKLMTPLGTEEKKCLLESWAFDCFTDEEFADLQEEALR